MVVEHATRPSLLRCQAQGQRQQAGSNKSQQQKAGLPPELLFCSVCSAELTAKPWGL
jgi:hypothetical protein